MSTEQRIPPPTLALSTKVEEDFVSPLTAIRGALEILRDFQDLAQPERQRFIEIALQGCGRLEKGVEQLADTVYAAGLEKQPQDSGAFSDRIHFFPELDVVELDFQGFEFDSTERVNQVYDAIEAAIAATDRQWYVLVNFRDCSIWPVAWVAFAHRGKKLNAACSLGTVRYADAAPDELPADPNIRPSREDALAAIEDMKAAASSTNR